MTKEERKRALDAMMEAILAATNALKHEDEDDFGKSWVYAQAALAALEQSGFKVVRDADRT